MKVLYLAGSGRSGTTIFGNILGQTDGFLSVGELFMTWERALVRPNACGCTRLILDCPFWTQVFQQAFGGIDQVDPGRMSRVLGANYRTRNYLLRDFPPGANGTPVEVERFLRELSRLYHSIASVGGARVIVDSSKRPVYGAMLGQLPGVELYVLHLVRDPRAVAYSWSRNKVDPVTGRKSTQMGLIESSLQWWGLNLVTERLLGEGEGGSRYLRMKYEEFAVRPKWAYQAVLELLGEPQSGNPFVGDHEVRLRPSHTIVGNNSRYAQGVVPIAPDDRWKSQMSSGRRHFASLLTWPLLLRYGYPPLNPEDN